MPDRNEANRILTEALTLNAVQSRQVPQNINILRMPQEFTDQQPKPKKAVQRVVHPRFDILTPQQRAKRCNPDDPNCSFYSYQGNRLAVLFAMGIFNESLEKLDETKQYATHACNCVILLTGEASCGKTFYAECFAKGLELPKIDLLGSAIRGNPDRIVKMILSGYQRHGINLVPYQKVGDRAYYHLPRAVLFIDEAHNIKGDAEESLLTMCEGSDRRLVLVETEFDCCDVAIIAATNRMGRWGSAIKTRLQKIPLQTHSDDNVANILSGKMPDLTEEECRLIVSYENVPREVEPFAQAVLRNAKLFNVTVKEAIPVTAKMLGKNPGGMSDKAKMTLKILADARPAGLSRMALCASLGIEMEEFINDVLPHLLPKNGRPAYIQVSNRHKITPAGLEFVPEEE